MRITANTAGGISPRIGRPTPAANGAAGGRRTNTAAQPGENRIHTVTQPDDNGANAAAHRGNGQTNTGTQQGGRDTNTAAQQQGGSQANAAAPSNSASVLGTRQNNPATVYSYTPKTFIGSSKDDAAAADSVYQRLKRLQEAYKKARAQKKKLNYNSREIRSALMRAVKSQSAGMVLSSAKSKLIGLLKCKGTGMYEENELNAAITHARRMVRCAQLKVRNLTKEERQKHRDRKSFESDCKDTNMEQLQRALRQKQRKLALVKKRRMHRNLERMKMDQADEEYKQKQAQNQAQSKQTSTAITNYSAPKDLSGLELDKIELELSKEEAQLTIETANLAMEAAAADLSAGGETAPTAVFTDTAGAVQTAVMPGGADLAAGGAIDICL